MYTDLTDHDAATALPPNAPDDPVTLPDSLADPEPLTGCSETRQEAQDAVLWPLVNGGVTKISPGDVHAVAQCLWRAVKIAGHTYAYTTTLEHRRFYLHRLLCGEFKYWDEAKGKWKTHHTDHQNGDGLDNTRGNLRSCDHRQNQQNGVGHPTVRRSRFKGVAFCKNARKRPWRATITVNGRQVHGGYFASEEDAARRYDAMSREFFQEFARPNLADNKAHPEST